MNDDWLIWQLADATFPAGGFAHSGGLEAVYQWGELRGNDELVEFLETILTQIGRSQVLFMTTVHRDLERIGEVDRFCHAFLSNHVANRASRLQGKAMLVSAEAAFGLTTLSQLREQVRRGSLEGHFAPVFGAVTAALNVTAKSATHLLLYIVLRGLISSAIRLNVVGPFQGQAVQYHFGPFVQRLVERCSQCRLEDVAQTAPMIEILHGTHDRLYSRLFRS
ncbi:MAG: urease accessory protein UreF [Planctomycetia bacterium]|nr:urease accessory protein UreF [Planctomycetia bacterium]